MHNPQSLASARTRHMPYGSRFPLHGVRRVHDDMIHGRRLKVLNFAIRDTDTAVRFAFFELVKDFNFAG